MKRLLSIFACFSLFFSLCASSHARVIATIPNTTTPTTVSLLPIRTQSHHVTTKIKNGVATTTFETVYFNPNNRVLEGTYLFALPKGASVSQFSLWIDGKEMPAELLDATKARNLYIEIVRKMIDPALLEFVGRETFKMRIFPFPANDSRKIKLSYQQVLPMDGNLMRYEYPLTAVSNGHDDTIEKLSWNIQIDSEIPLKSVFSPTHKVKITKEDDSASVSYEGDHVATDRDFVLYISNSHKKVDLSFIPFAKEDEKGYFLLILSPKTEIDPDEINAKDIVYILDTSGSMVGDKMEQAKRALQYCLHQLRPDDRFNIIPFSTEASPYQDKLISASSKNVKKALEYVEEEIYARGGTNIEEALGYALEMAPKSDDRPYMVVLMTDGKPTIGVTDAKEIIAKVQKANIDNLRLFTFGIGEQLNTKLLDQLAEENRGAREYVGAKEDIEIKISSFVDKISSPVLSNIQIRFPSSEGLRVTEVYPRQFPDLFKGSRITMLGRYKGSGDQAIRVTGIIGGETQEFVYEVSFPEENQDNDHIPRLWAVRKVGFLLDQIRLHGESDELKKEVVHLAKKFGIVTPYTSYLVIEDTPQIAQPVTREPEPFSRDRAREESVIVPGFGGEKDDAAGSDMFSDSSGETAVKTSKEVRDMREAEGVYNIEKNKKRESGLGKSNEENVIRKIAYKTFYKKGSVWYDSDSFAKEAKKAEKVRIAYMSEEYIALLKKFPELGKFLAIGSRVVVVWKGKIYEIYVAKDK